MRELAMGGGDNSGDVRALSTVRILGTAAYVAVAAVPAGSSCLASTLVLAFWRAYARALPMVLFFATSVGAALACYMHWLLEEPGPNEAAVNSSGSLLGVGAGLAHAGVGGVVGVLDYLLGTHGMYENAHSGHLPWTAYGALRAGAVLLHALLAFTMGVLACNLLIAARHRIPPRPFFRSFPASGTGSS